MNGHGVRGTGPVARRGSHPALGTWLGTAAATLLVGGALWWRGHYLTPPTPQKPDLATTSATHLVRLSAATVGILAALDGEVELRYFRLLGRPSEETALQEFAARLDQLLAQYERHAAGRLRIVRFDADSSEDEALRRAQEAGLTPFNLHQGRPWYLGLSVHREGRKEVLPRLVPEWEPALEADVSRAIQRLQSGATVNRSAVAGSTLPLAPAVLEEVRRRFPDLSSISLEEAIRRLQESALQELQATMAKAQVQASDAEKRVTEAQTTGSDLSLKEARAQLQRVQLDQADALKAVAARSAALMEALRQLKATTP